MPKLNYFDSLERLSLLSSRAVFIACSAHKPSSHNEMVNIRHSADITLCELEKALFSDFMPPLERNNIAACAHSLQRILEKSSDILNYQSSKNFFAEKKNKEAELCIRLSGSIEENIFRLRKIKKPEELPDFIGFRSLLSDARAAHTDLQKKLNSGAYPKNAQQTLNLLGRLRCELSRCFDDIIEIMLNNI
jgi:hypothetical protein